MKKTFSIKTLFNSAFQDYKNNWGIFILACIILLLTSFIGLLGSSLDPQTGIITSHPLVSIISSLLQVFIGLGFIRFLLNLIDGKKYSLEDLFRGANSFYHYLYFAVGTFLYGVLVTLGSILFIIPGIIMMIGFYFVQYILAEEKAGIFESFKQSWEMTKGNRWKILWLLILILLFNILGALALIIGLFITIPVSYIIGARLYRTLSGETINESNENSEIEISIEETVVIEEKA